MNFRYQAVDWQPRTGRFQRLNLVQRVLRALGFTRS